MINSWIPFHYSDIMLLQIQFPDINLVMILGAAGMIELVCLGCILGGHYANRKRKYSKSARATGFSFQAPEGDEGCRYVLLVIVAFVGPALLVAFAGPGIIEETFTLAVWWWLIFWTLGIPIIIIRADLVALRNLERVFLEQCGSRRPAEPIDKGDW